MSEMRLLAAFDGSTAHIRVIGRATFACSTCFRKFGEELTTEGIDHLVIDMKDCPNMDSTFMGVLTKFALELRKRQERIQLAQATPDARRLLAELGVKKLFDFTEDAEPEVDWCQIYDGESNNGDDLLEQGKTSLQAHQKLIEADQSNLGRFGAVVDGLSEDVAGLEADSKE